MSRRRAPWPFGSFVSEGECAGKEGWLKTGERHEDRSETNGKSLEKTGCREKERSKKPPEEVILPELSGESRRKPTKSAEI